jgi:hypothetical protein
MILAVLAGQLNNMHVSHENLQICTVRFLLDALHVLQVGRDGVSICGTTAFVKRGLKWGSDFDFGSEETGIAEESSHSFDHRKYSRPAAEAREDNRRTDGRNPDRSDEGRRVADHVPRRSQPRPAHPPAEAPVPSYPFLQTADVASSSTPAGQLRQDFAGYSTASRPPPYGGPPQQYPPYGQPPFMPPSPPYFAHESYGANGVAPGMPTGMGFRSPNPAGQALYQSPLWPSSPPGQDYIQSSHPSSGDESQRKP